MKFLKLLNVQSQIKAPKSQFNKFGNYKYRSCEDILEAVKPLLEKEKAIIIIDDDMVVLGDRFYVKAIAKFIDAENGEVIAESKAMAREPDTKKGMDESQITGSTSSYARKYALNGLLLIDDNKDSDSAGAKVSTQTQSQTQTKTTQDTKCTQQEYIKKIKLILWEVSNKNEQKSKELLQTYTSFTGKDGKVVAGVTDTSNLSIGRLQATYGKIKKDFPDVATKVKAQIMSKG